MIRLLNFRVEKKLSFSVGISFRTDKMKAFLFHAAELFEVRRFPVNPCYLIIIYPQ